MSTRWQATPSSLIAAVLLALSLSLASGAEILSPTPRSGWEFMSRETQAMQQDNTANPGMLWVIDGESLWNAKAGAADRACADCHGAAKASMQGIAARYPAYDANRRRPIDLQGRINACREAGQNAEPWLWESRELLTLTTYVAHQSRGMAVETGDDPRLAPFINQGRQLYEQRQGQLDFSCAECHGRNWGQRLGSSVIPQAHPTGYPLYRLEWQTVGSLQRRLRNCMTGVRAEPYPFGSPELVDLELFLMVRARGMPIETPAVRP